MYRSRRNAGFTLLEALVAIAIIAVTLPAIGSLVAFNTRSTFRLDVHQKMVATSRTILTNLRRNQITLGILTGDENDQQWRINFTPFRIDDSWPRNAFWTPQTVVLQVRSLDGQTLQIETIRLKAIQRSQQ